MKSIDNTQTGFTLTELLIAISVTSIVFIGIMNFLVRSIADNSVRQTKAELLRDAQLSLDVMTKDIRLSGNVSAANTVSDPNSPNAESTFGRGWESSSDILILSKSAEDNNRSILFEDPNRYVTEKDNIVYFINNGNLYKRTIAAEVDDNKVKTSCPEAEANSECPKDIELVKNVESISLKYFDGINSEVEPDQARSVEATLILSSNKFGRQIRAEYTTRTVFRNE